MTKNILLPDETVKSVSLLEWAEWFESNPAARIIAKTRVAESDVSTVFLGIDHSFGDGPPILFETMVFGGPLNQEQERYCTLKEAKDGHKSMCDRVITKTHRELKP